MTWRNKDICPKCGGKMLHVVCLNCDYERNFITWSFAERWPVLLFTLAVLNQILIMITLYNLT